jgi:hypothetical protein
MRIATEPAHVYSGNKAIEYALPVSDAEISCTLQRVLNPEQDTVFMRMYQKWAADYAISGGANHNGIRLSAKYPNIAGTIPPADGTGFFLFLLQNAEANRTGEVAPGYTDLYVYWPKQRSEWGDHWHPDGTVLPSSPTIGNKGEWLAYPNQYPDFKPYPMFIPQRDRWYCYELMVKANTPGTNDGEVKYWIDGKVAGDFPNLNLRSIPTLKIDWASFNLHETKVTTPLTKWHDNVVIATQYIGPMTPLASPTPTATPAPTSPPPTPTPTPTPTSTPQPTPSVTPSPSPSTVSVVASWQATQGDSYKVHYGTGTGQYTTVIDAGPSDSFVIGGLLPMTTYYFALTSVRNGIESPKSQETVYTTTLSLQQNLKLGPP